MHFQVDDDFIAAYQASYGVGTAGEDQPAVDSGAAPAAASQLQVCHWVAVKCKGRVTMLLVS